MPTPIRIFICHCKATMRPVRSGLRVLVALLLAWTTLPATSQAQMAGDAWYRAALQHVAHVAEDFGLSTYGLYNDDGDTFHQWTVDELAAQVQSDRLAIPLVRFGLLPGHEDTGVR